MSDSPDPIRNSEPLPDIPTNEFPDPSPNLESGMGGSRNDLPDPIQASEQHVEEGLEESLETEDDDELDEELDNSPQRAWLTPVLAVVMLVVGLFLGYTGRPIVQPLLAGKAAATQEAELPSVNPTLAPGQPTPTLMEFLVSNTQHFKGDADAPITMIEFSDYQ